jgi:hypothetical protein
MRKRLIGVFYSGKESGFKSVLRGGYAIKAETKANA